MNSRLTRRGVFKQAIDPKSVSSRFRAEIRKIPGFFPLQREFASRPRLDPLEARRLAEFKLGAAGGAGRR
jgi:hypothetical protein